jgi:hypothetical protein
MSPCSCITIERSIKSIISKEYKAISAIHPYKSKINKSNNEVIKLLIRNAHGLHLNYIIKCNY